MLRCWLCLAIPRSWCRRCAVLELCSDQFANRTAEARVSPSVLLTMGGKGSALAHITPLADATSLSLLPVSKDVPTANAVKLHEVDPRGEAIAVEGGVGKVGKGKGRDWLTLLVRETLGEHSPFNVYFFVLIHM